MRAHGRRAVYPIHSCPCAENSCPAFDGRAYRCLRGVALAEQGELEMRAYVRAVGPAMAAAALLVFGACVVLLAFGASVAAVVGGARSRRLPRRGGGAGGEGDRGPELCDGSC